MTSRRVSLGVLNRRIAKHESHRASTLNPTLNPKPKTLNPQPFKNPRAPETRVSLGACLVLAVQLCSVRAWSQEGRSRGCDSKSTFWTLWTGFSIVLYCIILYDIVLYCIILYDIVLYCIILFYLVFNYIALFYLVLYYTILYYIIVYCIILYCIIVYFMKL